MLYLGCAIVLPPDLNGITVAVSTNAVTRLVLDAASVPTVITYCEKDKTKSFKTVKSVVMYVVYASLLYR